DLVALGVGHDQGVVDGGEELGLLGVRVAVVGGEVGQGGAVRRQGWLARGDRGRAAGVQVEDLDPAPRRLAGEPVVLLQQVQVRPAVSDECQVGGGGRLEQELGEYLGGAGRGVHPHHVGTRHGDGLGRDLGRGGLGRLCGGGRSGGRGSGRHRGRRSGGGSRSGGGGRRFRRWRGRGGGVGRDRGR